MSKLRKRDPCWERLPYCRDVWIVEKQHGHGGNSEASENTKEESFGMSMCDLSSADVGSEMKASGSSENEDEPIDWHGDCCGEALR
jgi:hypothetical protein